MARETISMLSDVQYIPNSLMITETDAIGNELCIIGKDIRKEEIKSLLSVICKE